MHPIKFVRRGVFKTTQAEFADIADVSQGTVSRWESGAFEPTREQLVRIRDSALDRNLPWNDSWFFDNTAREKRDRARTDAEMAA
jgi:transcriptional regulator with XRE-family HTH domain